MSCQREIPFIWRAMFRTVWRRFRRRASSILSVRRDLITCRWIRKSSTARYRCCRQGEKAHWPQSGVKFAAANPSFGGPPHSNATSLRKDHLDIDEETKVGRESSARRSTDGNGVPSL